MPRVRELRSVLTSLFLGLLLLSGCGKSGATLTGKLVLPPEMKLDETNSATILFVPEVPRPPYLAPVSASDMSFVAHGPDSKSIPAGKYKIAVELHYLGSSNSEKHAAVIEPFNKNYNPTNTKLTYEVTTDSTQSITIDCVKGTVTKN